MTLLDPRLSSAAEKIARLERALREIAAGPPTMGHIFHPGQTPTDRIGAWAAGVAARALEEKP